ncbi:hypothetical protein KU6B_24930 [Mameliella alba]|nr:hypothetical protein KU6B_24930 [Mameliella alba]
MMKLRMAVLSHLVNLRDIPDLQGIEIGADSVSLGAMVTQDELIAHAGLGQAVPLRREAALQIANPQVRYPGTLGGNVANGDPDNDMPGLMQCLDATYQVTGPDDLRQIQARDFYESAYFTARADDEILTRLMVPIPAAGTGYAYEKQKRKIGDYATAAAAVLVGEGFASIAMTNLADMPVWSAEAGAALAAGDREGAVSAALAAIDPQEDMRGPVEFKRHVVGVVPRRAIDRALSRVVGCGLRGRLMSKMHVKLTVNGAAVEGLAEPRTLLIHFLRESLGVTGPHVGCETSHCGACTVDMDGRSVKSCTVFVAQARGADVTTVEGLVNADGSLSVLQEMFREHHGLQCGFCTPGMITRAHGFLQENPTPTEEEVRFGMAGNLCRCTGYQNIVKAILAAAEMMNAQDTPSSTEGVGQQKVEAAE